jgi:xanthine dehydrogenase accessory factor
MDVAFLRSLEAAIAARRPVATATVMDGPLVGAKLLVDGDGGTIAGTSGDPSADSTIAGLAAAMLRDRKTEERGVALPASEARVFVESYLPPPSLVVVGAAHIAIPLTKMAQDLGFDVTLIDAREWFLTEERFPQVERRILAWPDKGLAQVSLDTETYLVILSHDPKFERPALKYALPFPLRYIGAIGSRKTHADRIATLRAEGVSEDDLARIHAPIGLDIGAVTPEEVAVSIIAEMLAVRSGHPGGFMQRERSGKANAA